MPSPTSRRRSPAGLVTRAVRKAGVLTRRGAKRFRQSLTAGDVHAAPLFVVGCQRSGTNMLINVLERSPDTWTYNEDHPRAFANCRIRSLETRNRLIRKARCRWVVFKPICDSQNIDRLLEEHPDGKAIWEFRRYQDVANSALRNWGLEHQLWMIRMAATDPRWDHWLVERMSPQRRQLVRDLYNEGMSYHTAAALKWYLRNAIYFDHGLDRRPDRVKLVRYEDVVQDPLRQFAAMFEFLGLEFRPFYAAEVFATSVRKESFPAIDPRVERLCEEISRRLHAALQAQERGDALPLSDERRI